MKILVSLVSGAAAPFAPPLRALGRAIIARGTRRALDTLRDDLIRDVGLTRGEILYLVGRIAGHGPPAATALQDRDGGARKPARRAA